MPGGTTTTVAAVRIADGRVLRYATDERLLRRPPRRLRRHGRGPLARRPHARARRLDAEAQNGRPSPSSARTPLRLLKRVTVKGRWAFDALSPDGRTLYALQYLATGPNPRYASARQPRHRQAGRRRDRRQARAGRGDERRAVGAGPQCERRLGLHALRQAGRHRVRPRARHGAAARVLRRPPVALDDAGARARAAVARAAGTVARALEARRHAPAGRRSTRRRSRCRRSRSPDAGIRRRPGRPRSPPRSPARPRRCRGSR